MPRLQVDGEGVADAEVADSWAARARGMLWRRRLPEALILRPCNSVHGAGMRVALDVAYLSAEGVVLDITVLRPWAMTRPRKGAVAVLEAPLGNFDRWGLRVGSVVGAADDMPVPEQA